MDKWSSIIGNIIIIVLAGFFIGAVMLFSSFILIPPNAAYLVPIIVGIYVFLIFIIAFYIFAWWKSIIGKRLFWILTAFIIIGSFTASGNTYYKASVEQINPEVDLYAYQPFADGTRAVVLAVPATLQISENLPILDGATALYPIYSAFAQAVYPKKNYDLYDSEVMSNRTGEAYDNLINGRVDMIFALPPSAEQQAAARHNGRELTLTPIGKEAFVFFVNKKNPVKNLTTKEIKGIYAGEISNWKEVGGKRKKIHAFQRAEGSGSQTALQNFMGDTPIMGAPSELTIDLMGGMIHEVSAYRNYTNAIGFTFRYYSTEMIDDDQIRLLAVDGVEPEVESIQSDKYPLTSEFYIVTAGSENPHIEEFIEWVLSSEGQEIIERSGYVPINGDKR